MLNNLQQFCLNLLVKLSKQNQDIHSLDNTTKELYQDQWSLLLGNNELFYKIQRYETLLKNTPNLAFKADIEKFIAMLKKQQQNLDSFNRIVGFRKICLELYLEMQSKETFSSDPKKKELVSLLRQYIISGNVTDLNRYIRELNKLKNDYPDILNPIWKQIQDYVDQFPKVHQKLKTDLENKKFPIMTPTIQENCNILLTLAQTESMAGTNNEKTLANKIMLVDVIKQTHRALQCPENKDTLETCHHLSTQLNGKHSTLKQVGGVLLFIVGYLASLAGVVLTATPLFPLGGAMIGGGVLAMGTGFGLFHHGRQKNLSKAVDDVAQEVGLEESRASYLKAFEHARGTEGNLEHIHPLFNPFIPGFSFN